MQYDDNLSTVSVLLNLVWILLELLLVAVFSADECDSDPSASDTFCNLILILLHCRFNKPRYVSIVKPAFFSSI